MDKYIERETFLDAIERMKPCHQDADDIAEMLQNFPAADVVPASDFRDCRNELCLKCGAYTQKHLGACDGCRWRKTDG